MNPLSFIATLHQIMLPYNVTFDCDNDSGEIIVTMGDKRLVISTNDVEDNTEAP